MPRFRPVVTSAALLATTLSGAVLGVGPVAGAAPLEGAVAAPATCASGPSSRFVVLFGPGTAEADAVAEIGAACGTTTVYYPEIAVAVATSRAREFVDRIGRDRAFSAHRTPARRTTEVDRTATSAVTTDPARVPAADRTAEQWDMAMIGAPAAHRVFRGSPEVLVGVLDAGIDASHPELAAAVDATDSAGCLTGRADTSPQAWLPTRSSHGTHVAGIIAAADDRKGVTGVAPGVRIASVKVVDDAGRILPEAAVCGLMWAASHRMAVTNNSYVVDPWLLTCSRNQGERVVYEAVRRAVDHATSRGVLTVAAASNEGADLANPRGQASGNADGGDRRTLDGACRVLPAGLRDVVAVSSVGPDEVKAGYSAYGLGVIDVAAPGGERARNSARPDSGCVLSTVPNGYERSCGTSMATPHVTGVAALLKSANPSATPKQLTRMLTSQASGLACPADYDLNGTGAQDAFCSGYEGYNGFYGHGLVNALTAVADR